MAGFDAWAWHDAAQDERERCPGCQRRFTAKWWPHDVPHGRGVHVKRQPGAFVVQYQGDEATIMHEVTGVCQRCANSLTDEELIQATIGAARFRLG